MIDTEKMPKLGFGLMRLPTLGSDTKIDMDHVCKMVDQYMEAGLNYFDTAYVYHSGISECVVKEAIVKRYPREKFKIATKLPAWCMKEKKDRERIFQEQLDRTGAGYFDYYLIHSIEEGYNYDTYEKLDCFNFCMEKKKQGLIRHFGFSFHGSPDLLIQVLDRHPEIEFVQIQLNYLDWNHPIICSGKLYEILHERNIPMIIMEPVKGGALAALKPELEAKMKAVRPDKSVASWALRFVASLPGVMTILSGMSNEEQMMDNISTFHPFEPMSEGEHEVIDEIVQTMMNIPLIGCTACRYCTDGCPMNIPIPDIFRTMNTLTLYPGDMFRPMNFYREVTREKGKAGDCISCGQCEGVCPQHLPIIQLLQEASQKLDR